MKEIIAHKNNEEIQLLSDHLSNVSKIAGRIGEKIDMKNIAVLVSLLHDLGKADRNFQKYIYENTNEHINHSSAGARYLLEKIKKIINQNLDRKKEWLLFLEILEYVIFSHHGLYDVISKEGESRTKNRRNYDDKKESSDRKYYYEEDVKKYAENLESLLNINFDEHILNAFKEFEAINKKINKVLDSEEIEIIDEDIENKDEKIKEIRKIKRYFYYHCTVRLILSILKEADISDTVNVFAEEKIAEINEKEIMELWNNIENNVENKYRKFEKSGSDMPINRVRKKLSEEAKKRGKTDTAGVYRLELPTGSGKTLTSFRYAVEQAKHQKKDRIIYVTAFLSVLEQNAEEIKKIVKNDECILEHHSNALEENEYYGEEYGEKYKEMIKRQHLLNSWDSPVILTTMVQFYNTLFKGKASNIRRFSKLINSVVIVDEVQSLPKKTVYISNLMTNFMKYFMNCTIVHCTATQPCFDDKILEHRVLYGNKKNENSDIVSMKIEEKSVFDRVKIYNKSGKGGSIITGTKELAEFIAEIYEKEGSILVILNTKKAVKKIYDNLKEKLESSDKNLYYLSTNMCAAHRLDKIKEIKEKLSKNEKIVCVSTQLIEAGVDVDFNTVIRSMTGIDSMIQSIGRCNREGKLEKGNFYIVNYSEEEFKYLKEIKKSAESASKILEENIEKIDDLRERYYRGYYINNTAELRYNIEKTPLNLLSLLSENSNFRSEYKKMQGKSYNNYNIAQSFKTAATVFNLIDSETTPIIVNYDKNSDKLIGELKEAMKYYKISVIKSLLKKLQRYTINIFDIKKVERFLDIHREYGVYILLDDYYRETGIETEELTTLII